jgi:twitching motility protein PilT
MIVTIEDPIEILHSNQKSIAVQREIGQDAPSFSEALIAAMRQDPDVIMIGEIRALPLPKPPFRRHKRGIRC